MRNLALLGAVAVLTVGGIGATTAAQEVETDSTPDTCDDHRSGWHITRGRQMSRAAWAEKKWRDPSPVHSSQRRVIETAINCLRLRKDQKAIGNTWRRQKTEFGKWRPYRLVTPYAGFRGEGKWLRYLAVPSYIVACETNGYSGEGRWGAANSSGAIGPYQLLGWGAPWPVSGYRDKLEHHRIAHGLSLSNWACA